MDRTDLEFNLSFVSLQNKNSSLCHLDIIHGSGDSPSRLPVFSPLSTYEDAKGLWTIMAAGTESLDAELLKDLRGLGKPPSFDGTRCTVPRLSIQLQKTHGSRESAGRCTLEVLHADVPCTGRDNERQCANSCQIC